MTFDEAEARFRELQARVQRGEPISRAEYEDQVSQLAVQDDRGVLWEINPRTGKWMYFDGAEWVGGIPPGRDTSTVMPLPRGLGAPSGGSAPTPRPTSSIAPPPSASIAPPPNNMAPISPRSGTPPAPRTAVPMTTSPRSVASPGTAAPPRTSPPSPEAVPPYRRVGPEQTGGAPSGAPGGEAIPKRGARQGPLGGPNREWVPLAIGAVVLLFCAMLLFVGGRFALSALGPTSTPTRATVVALATNTPVPTVVRLPTQPLPPASPAPVIAKVIEASVNVRGTPSTSGKIIGKLRKDNTISLTGRSVDGQWYQATVQGVTGPGWVFKETLQIASGDPAMLPLAGPGAPTPTKPAAPAPGSGGAATPTVIGARP
jgi:hypothetical protein